MPLSYVLNPLFTFYFETGALQIIQDSLELAILLHQPPQVARIIDVYATLSLCYVLVFLFLC